MAGPFISFLTDFGGELAPATCRGVIWSIAEDARILDLNHNVRKFAVRDGAFLLSRAVAYLPIGVHLAVVDPGVGTERRPIAVRVGRGDLLVGPDNGLLMPAAAVLGGVIEARTLTDRTLFLPTVSDTFHGRDLFAPVAAALAKGATYGGTPLPTTAVRHRHWPDDLGAVIYIDGYGNLITGYRAACVPEDTIVRVGHHAPVRAHTFGDVPVGTLMWYENSIGMVEIAVNQGSAAALLRASIGTTIEIG